MLEINYSEYNNYVTGPLTQWDVNQKLKITGDIDSVPTILFSNRLSITAEPVTVKNNNDSYECDIPNGLLSNPYPILAYIRITKNGETVTIGKIKIPIIPAKKPEDYTYIENITILSYEELLSIIENKVENDIFDNEISSLKGSIATLHSLLEEIQTTGVTSSVVENKVENVIDDLISTGVLKNLTIVDGTITGRKTNFMTQDFYVDNESIYSNICRWAVSNTSYKVYHNANNNWNFIGSKDKYRIRAVSAYINYIWTAENPTKITSSESLTVIEYGGTYKGCTYYGHANAPSPEEHEIMTEKPEGANYLLVDFGYTKPQNLESYYMSDEYHVQKDGVWSESIKNEAVTEEKLSDNAVTEEKISNEAVGKEKIKTGAIDANGLDISYKRLYVEPYVAAEGLRLYNRGVQSCTNEIQSNIYCIELKAGKKYMVISEDYPRDENVTVDRTNGDSTNMVNSRFGVSSVKIIDWRSGDNLGERCDLAEGAYVHSAIKSLNTKGNVILNDALASSDSNYYPSMFTAVTDLYLYFASYVPVGTQYLVTVPTGSYFLEVEEVPDFDEPTDYVTTTNNQFLEPFRYVRNYTDHYMGEKIRNNNLVTNYFASKRNKALETALFRTSRNISDYTVCAYIIGDSITYAASNAGLQNAWRKYITTKTNLYLSYTAVSGTTMTYGYGTDWSSAINGASSSIEFTGVRGIKTAIKTVGKGSTKQQHAFSLGLMEFAIIALGTNDFGNNAKLGSVETFDDDGTFYGATYQLFHFLHDEIGIPYVIFVAPFKRENWNVQNQAEVPYTIYDLAHALAEISLLENDMYVFDCTDRWYLNYDDPAIRDKSFIDYVHIKPYAHHMFTIDLAIFIQNIVSARGLKHFQPEFKKI